MIYKIHFSKVIESIVEIEAGSRNEAHKIAGAIKETQIEENQETDGWAVEWLESQREKGSNWEKDIQSKKTQN